MRRRMLSLSMAIALVTIPGGPGGLAAQACIGAPVGASHNAITAQVGFPDGATVYGATFRHDAEGPWSAAPATPWRPTTTWTRRSTPSRAR